LAGGGRNRRLRLLEIAAGMGEAGGLVDLAPQVEDGQPRDRPQAQQDAPDGVVGHVRGQQDGGEEGTHDQAGTLHGEDETDHPAPRLLSRVLAHDGGAHGIVAADPDAKMTRETNRNV
jgi:hypothetical protein